MENFEGKKNQNEFFLTDVNSNVVDSREMTGNKIDRFHREILDHVRVRISYEF